MLEINIFNGEEVFERYTPGEVIFKEGDIGRVMYGVCEGETEIRFRNRVFETVKAGGIFGKLSIIDDSPHTATAVAKTD